MPVEVIEVASVETAAAFHRGFIKFMGDAITSKFPEREDHNFYPHMTVTWDGAVVVDEGAYEGQERLVKYVWILKDDSGDRSAYRKYELGIPPSPKE